MNAKNLNSVKQFVLNAGLVKSTKYLVNRYLIFQLIN